MWGRDRTMPRVFLSVSDTPQSPNSHPPFTATGRIIGRTRFIVLVPVIAVILISITLFLMGAIEGGKIIWYTGAAMIQNASAGTPGVTVEFLTVIGTLLRAVAFYVIGVGLFSLFIAPLNLTASIGIESLGDLESKVLSVVVLIMAVIFLEHFTRWESPGELMYYAGAFAMVVLALVAFQWNSRQHSEFAKAHELDSQKRARIEIFVEHKEEREIRPEEVEGEDGEPDGSGSKT